MTVTQGIFYIEFGSKIKEESKRVGVKKHFSVTRTEQTKQKNNGFRKKNSNKSGFKCQFSIRA